MRNPQIKKVNRIFFAGQSEEKKKWLEQMTAEGWQLVSETSFIYSFQKITSEKVGFQSSIKAALKKDFLKSMPIFQDSTKNNEPSTENNFNLNNPINPIAPEFNKFRSAKSPRYRRYWVLVFSVLFFLTALLTRITSVTYSSELALSIWLIQIGALLTGFSLVLLGVLFLKRFIKIFRPESKNRK